jgi:hypothetical protein
MDNATFDTLVRSLTTATGRRVAVKALAGTFGLTLLGADVATVHARVKGKPKRKKGKGKKKKGGGGGPIAPPPGPRKQLGELCTPQVDTCAAGLACDAPTTRHTCDSTVDDISTWCCVPRGGSCAFAGSECVCCGDNYCDGSGKCLENPEG